MELYIFYFISFFAVATASYFVFAKHPLYGILSLIATFFSVAGLFVLLNAQFLGIVQVIVYAGAIMVLFLYILMMLNLNKDNEEQRKGKIRFLSVFSVGLFLLGILGAYRGFSQGKIEHINTEVGLIKNLGKVLFNEYVLPFELASILILVGIVGSVLIGKKDL